MNFFRNIQRYMVSSFSQFSFWPGMLFHGCFDSVLVSWVDINFSGAYFFLFCKFVRGFSRFCFPYCFYINILMITALTSHLCRSFGMRFITGFSPSCRFVNHNINLLFWYFLRYSRLLVKILMAHILDMVSF